MDVFAQNERADVVPVLDRLIAHDDFEVRSTALRVRAQLKPDKEMLLKWRGEHLCKGTRATALVALVARDWVPLAEAERELLAYAEDPHPAVRRAVASAIRHGPSPALADLLVKLAESPDGAVLSEVALAMGSLGDRRFVAPLIAMLIHRGAREAARTALVAIGRDALDALAQALADTTRPHELRRHLPRTISRFHADEAAPILVRHLLDDPDGMVRYKVLRGLCNLHADSPDVPIDRQVLDQAIERTVADAFRMLDSLASLERGAEELVRRATPAHDLLVDLLRSKEQHAVDRLFRLLRLRHPREAFRDIQKGLSSPNAKTRASALELVENVLRGPLRVSVLALVGDGAIAERLDRAQPFFTPERLAYDDAIRAIHSRGRGTLHLVAEHQARDIGLDLVATPPRAIAEPATENAGDAIRRAVDAFLGPGDPEPVPT
ncbi:MAG: HEAT repeat domain-containing protein [Deltaproteobacteria bacterium]|nr:HEAT repeat domain-containing protein [Deltaproteobacteria bacterium]